MAARFKVLGRTRLLVGDRFDDRWGERFDRALLAVLLLHPGQPVAADELVEWLRPDTEPPALSTLQESAARIAAALRRMAEPPILVVQRDSYRIDVDPLDVDIVEFRELTSRARLLGRSGGHAAARDLLKSALDTWSEPLGDLRGPTAARWRREVADGIWLAAQCDLLGELAALGEYAEVLWIIDNLPAGHEHDVRIMKRRLEAMVGLERRDDVDSYLVRHRAAVAEAEQTELNAFNDALRRQAAGVPQPPESGLAPAVPRLRPPDVPDLVGRDAVLDQLDALADGPAHTVITVDGEPGVGKTALVLRWAHRAAHRFPGGQCYIDLGGVGAGRRVTPTTVVTGLLGHFDVNAELIPSAEARARKLRDLLSGRRAVIVLDDAADGEHVLPLLDQLPCLLVIISRQRLSRLADHGAVRLSVPPLSYTHAARWLGGKLGPRAWTEPGELAALTKLCDGNALALHVVAEHAASKPELRVAEIVDELRTGAALLDLGADADHRGSVRAAFSASYLALDAPTRRLFRLLGVHPGPTIGVEAAAALTGQAAHVVAPLLDTLVNHHLLVAADTRRRYQFHDLLRAFAAACANIDEERRAAERRMLNFYHHGLLRAEEIIFPDRPRESVEDLLPGVPELAFDESSAISWCVRERINITFAVRLAVDREFHDYATHMPNATEILYRLGYVEEVEALLTIAIESARKTGNPSGLANLHLNLAHILISRRDFDPALDHLLAAQRLYEQLGNAVGAASVVVNHARVWIEQGEYEMGISRLRDALDTFRREDAIGSEIPTLRRLADAYRRFHRYAEAIDVAHEALRLTDRTNNESNRADGLAELCAAHCDNGDLTRAQRSAEEALSIFVRLNRLAEAGRVSAVLARVHLARKNDATAARHARHAAGFCAAGTDLNGRAIAEELLAESLYRQGRHQEAMTALSVAWGIFQDLGDSRADDVRARLTQITVSLPLVAPQRDATPRTVTHDRQLAPGDGHRNAL